VNEQTLVEHMPRAKVISYAIWRTLPRGSVLLEDLEQEAMIGLLQAERRFDPSRGMEFPAYAQHRMRSAIFDFLRRIDPLSRKMRRQVKQGDLPLDFGKQAGMLDLVCDGRQTAEERMIAVQLVCFLRALPELYRCTLEALYWNEESYRQIAFRLKLDTSAVSVLRVKAIQTLRKRMGVPRKGAV